MVMVIVLSLFDFKELFFFSFFFRIVNILKEGVLSFETGDGRWEDGWNNYHLGSCQRFL